MVAREIIARRQADIWYRPAGRKSYRPYGTGRFFSYHSRHVVPGYLHSVPTGHRSFVFQQSARLKSLGNEMLLSALFAPPPLTNHFSPITSHLSLLTPSTRLMFAQGRRARLSRAQLNRHRPVETIHPMDVFQRVDDLLLRKQNVFHYYRRWAIRDAARV
jgi:hypothetical protein